MKAHLNVAIGQYSHRGRKQLNQDCHGSSVPAEPQLSTKGIALAIADGISSSDVSQVASQTSVKSFLEDYYCTSETWSVKTSAERVLQANNSWLYAQNHRNHEFRLNKDKGYVCTFSTLIFKSNTAYLFHVGDAQISRLGISETRDKTEVLTQQHRLWLSGDRSYLARALGIVQPLEIDYAELPLAYGDVFFLATDGIYEYVSDEFVSQTITANFDDLDLAAKNIAEHALEQGSEDNLTVQIARIDALPSGQSIEFLQRQNELPFPPELTARMTFDGYQVLRDLHKSSRSHVLLGRDLLTQQKVVIKVPSTEGRHDRSYVERFLLEDWIANRLNNAHIVKSHKASAKRRYCYVVSEFVDGQTLAQWMVDNPTPSLDEVRSIVEQVAIGLQAFHRQEMLHQDLRPENIMIDVSGTAKIIDFGSTFVSGIEETRTSEMSQVMPGTAQFLAPEYFLGEFGSKQSDIYSLACIAYHMLSGRSPYGASVARALTRTAQHRLVYQSVLAAHRPLPAWVDLTLKKALQPDRFKRYSELSEFIQDLRKPNIKFIAQARPPLLERNPLVFWKGVSLIFGVVIIGLLYLNLN
ncbi:MAG: serine/threonine protein phosphatase PrpC [Arenicella sp.]|jgi:serine/threonine protein phosphatase PrpC